MRAGQRLQRAWETLAPAMGEIALALEVKRPIPKDRIADMVERLRRSANELEALIQTHPPKK